MDMQFLFICIITALYSIFFIIIGLNIREKGTYIIHITYRELILLLASLLFISKNVPRSIEYIDYTIVIKSFIPLLIFIMYLFYSRKNDTKLCIYNVYADDVKKAFDNALEKNGINNKEDIYLKLFEINPIKHIYDEIFIMKRYKRLDNHKDILYDFKNNIYSINKFKETTSGAVMILMGIIIMIMPIVFYIFYIK